jgi:F-type H+-transporting ATPase subunit alpha
MAVEDQVTVIWAANKGYLDEIPASAVRKYETEFLAFMKKEYPDVGHTIKSKGALSDDIEAKLKDACSKFRGVFKP